MIIKTFRAESSAVALKNVRLEMGGDAIVLKTSQITDNNKSAYEVTACLESPTVAQSSVLLSDIDTNITKRTAVIKTDIPDTNQNINETIVPTRESRLGDLEDIDKKIERILNKHLSQVGKDVYGEFQPVYDRLADMDFDKSYLDTFVKNLQEDYDNKEDIDSFARESLTAEFDALKSEPIQFNKNDKIAFMGPAGCGKSSVLGKLAATMVFENNQKVKLITLDDFKMGAYDEIAAYADILGADLNEVTAEEIESEENVLTFIDTPATPVEKEKLDELKNKIDKLNPNYRFVVLSALIRSKDISHLGNMMKEFSPTHLVVTKTDLTQSYGAVLTAARATGLQIVYISNSPGGIGKLDPLDSAKLTETLFTNEEVNE